MPHTSAVRQFQPNMSAAPSGVSNLVARLRPARAEHSQRTAAGVGGQHYPRLGPVDNQEGAQVATRPTAKVSFYDVSAVAASSGGEPDPIPPGTVLTHSIETIDNDRAGLMLEAGVLR